MIPFGSTSARYTDYDTLLISGRMTYAIMCFEYYVIFKYPDKDMPAITEKMWKIIDDSNFINNSAYHYMEIILNMNGAVF